MSILPIMWATPEEFIILHLPTGKVYSHLFLGEEDKAKQHALKKTIEEYLKYREQSEIPSLWGGQQLSVFPSLIASAPALSPAAAQQVGMSREQCLESCANAAELVLAAGLTLKPMHGLNLPPKGELTVAF